RWQFEPGLIPFSILHSSQIPGTENDYRGQNIAGIFSKKIDDFLIAWATEQSFDKQMELRQSINQIFVDEVFAIPLYEGKQAALVTKSLEGFQLTGFHRPSSA